MNHEEHDDLWRLLGQAKRPTVSPFFSRNVLRAIRVQAQEKPLSAWASGWLWIRQRWQVAAVGSFAAALLCLATWPQVDSGERISELARQVSASPDYAVIGHLDELLAYEENSVWLDNPTY